MVVGVQTAADLTLAPGIAMTYILTNMEAPMRLAAAVAKARFAELLRRAEAGEEIELTRYGRPVARLVSAGAGDRKPLIGALKGRIEIGPDFDELPGDLTEALGTPVEPRA